MVHLYTGGGKGKTTAALGLVLRAAGAGWKILFLQFLKGRPSGEIKALERFRDQVEVRRFGKSAFIVGEPSAGDLAEARAGLEMARLAVSGRRYRLVVLDEASAAVNLKLIRVEDLLELIDRKSPGVELVITGYRAHPRLVERADLVTEMKEVKHYYTLGIRARRGVEY